MPETITLEGTKAEITSLLSTLPCERYRIHLEAIAPPTPIIDYLAQAVQHATTRRPEEMQATRATIMAQTPTPNILPAHQTILDAVSGTWPGDESDTQIQVALERLS